MSHKKRNLCQSKHPLKSYPFEALFSGSWKAVELLKIESGTSTLHFINDQNRVLKKGPIPDIRMRSRKATLSDCSCFLRPGIDVCVLSASQQDNDSGKIFLEPEWVDARIRSVQRKPHVSECSCEYFVNLYVNQGCYVKEMRILDKEIKVVGINQISILQKLDHNNPCEDQHYRWDSSEDCLEARKTKLFAGKFLSDISWLLVTSVLKQVSFCVRSVESKIVYQILGHEHSSSSLKYNSFEHVNFRLDNGMLVPIVSHVASSDSNKVDQAKDSYEDEISPISCIEGLRRSKRRNIEPERYLGYDDVSKLDFGHVRTSLPKSNTRNIDDKDDVDLLPNCLEKDTDACQNVKINTRKEVLADNNWAASGNVKLENVDEKGHETQLASDSLPDGGGPGGLDHSFVSSNCTGNSSSRHEHCVFSEYNHRTHSPELNRKIVNPWTFEPYDRQSKFPDPENSAIEIDDKSTVCQSRKIVDPWTFEPYDRQSKLPDPENSAIEIDDKSSVCYHFGTSDVQRKDLSGQEDMDTENKWEGLHSDKEIRGKKYQPPMTRSRSRGEERSYKDRSLGDAGNSAKGIRDKSSRSYYFGTCNAQRKDLPGLEDMDAENGWEGICSNKVIQGKKYHSPMTRSNSHGEGRTYKKRSLSDAACMELIDLYLKNTDTAPAKEEPPITDQWVELKATRDYGQNRGVEADEEVSEIDMLWKEMEVALASSYVFDNTEGSKAAVVSEIEENSDKRCQHELRFDEEIGIYCLLCGIVTTEIRDITPPFLQNYRWQKDEKQQNAENLEAKADVNDSLHLFSDHTSTDLPVSEENDIWGLIPELTSKLHVHQKKAFEFLWKNISGSVEPESVKAASERIGGCVISHSPGAGKTFLIIAFLASYLKLFPGNKPLVLAPKTTLYTWYKEFIKWKIPIPVYLIQSRRKVRGACMEKSVVIPGVPKPTGDVRHLLDSLEKLQKWLSRPSVLIMSYSSFSRLMVKNSKHSYRNYMAKVLRESPGVLILDEGHNPRSTGSCLRKALMKVDTELRILLSGTLFQNNFCEYFNTLFLARPKFVHEVLRELDPKYRREKGRAERKQNFVETRARKLFLNKIGTKIDSNDSDERLQGLNMLRNITSGFIDVYESGSSDNLPGLHVYTLLMNITDCQDQTFKVLYGRKPDSNRYPLEVELLLTLGAIHPWLITTAACSGKLLTEAQRMKLEQCKFDLNVGPKVRFVLSLIYRVFKEEKTIVFFHYIAPMRLFVELFEKSFGWQIGHDVLVLNGEQDLFERGRVIDKFEEPGGASKVLLASITACSEGISLTAASRVILLDSEWNPSRTRQAIARAYRPGQRRIVYVYRLLVTGTMEEQKYRRTTWKEWVSRMIFTQDDFEEDKSQWQLEKLEDDILQEMIAEDKYKIFHTVMKDEKASIQPTDV